MEDHVGRILSSLLAAVSATIALAALLRATAGGPASVEWAALAVLTGLLAAASGFHVRAGRAGRAGQASLRAFGLGAGIAGGLMAGLLLVQSLWLVATAFRSRGPSSAIEAATAAQP